MSVDDQFFFFSDLVCVQTCGLPCFTVVHYHISLFVYYIILLFAQIFKIFILTELKWFLLSYFCALCEWKTKFVILYIPICQIPDKQYSFQLINRDCVAGLIHSNGSFNEISENIWIGKCESNKCQCCLFIEFLNFY